MYLRNRQEAAEDKSLWAPGVKSKVSFKLFIRSEEKEEVSQAGDNRTSEDRFS